MTDLRHRFFFAIAIFFLSPFSAYAFGESIDAFHIQIKLQTNGSAVVQEEIVYDFGENAVGRHGIFRRVPLAYTLPGEHTPRQIEISSIMVTDGDGNLIHSEYTGGGNYMQLKIGEPDVLVTGRHRYVIRYTVWGAINQSFTDKDEFYWNATGDEWDVPIQIVRTDIELPIPMNENSLVTACFVGPHGSTKKCIASTTPQEGTGVVNSVRYTYDNPLGVREGMTVSVAIPKNIYLIAPTSKVKTLADSVVVYHWWRGGGYLGLSVVIPIVVFIIMFRIWWYRGRDPKGSGTILTEYTIPDHLSPLEVAYLEHNTVLPVAISATIVDLAVRGYLTIARIEKKKLFITTEDFKITFTPNVDVSAFGKCDRILYDTLRSYGDTVLVSSLAHKLTDVSSALTTELSSDLTTRGYYAENPQIVTRHYLLSAIILILIGFVLPFGNFALIVSGVIILVFGFLMPKKTSEGAMVHERIQGFKEYLSVAEKDRIDFANAPEKDPTMFEEFLPYAMVFGVEHSWASKFSDMYTEKESGRWYNGGSGAVSATAIVGSMGAFSASTASAFTSSSSGAGGGSSGGGGGGGGGGSW